MKEATIKQIQQSITRLRTQHSNIHGSHEQQWMQRQLQDEHLQAIVIKLSITAFHTLSALEAGEQTGIELAKKLNVTRGGITRAAKRLLSYNLVEAAKHATDQKKIYYSLTADGKAIAHAHDQLHAQIQAKLISELSTKYSAQDLAVIAHFLDDLEAFEAELK